MSWNTGRCRCIHNRNTVLFGVDECPSIEHSTGHPAMWDTARIVFRSVCRYTRPARRDRARSNNGNGIGSPLRMYVRFARPTRSPCRMDPNPRP